MDSAISKNEMLHYFKQLSSDEQKSFLNMIKSFLQSQNGNKKKFEEYNKEIDEALSEVERGEFFTHEEVVKMSKNW